jgi:hypothetical protein
MPVTVRELSRPTNEVDAKNAGQFVRTFEVYATPPAAAINIAGVPAQNEVHPDFPSAKVDRKSADYFSPESSLVTVTYTTNRAARFSEPPPKPEQLPFPVWSMGSEKVSIDIPYAVLRSVSLPTLEGGTVTKNVYQTEKFTVEEERFIVRVKCSVPSVSTTQITAILNEVGNIHFLPDFPEGYQFLFTSPNLSMRSGDTTIWDIDYQWIGDKGTPIITGAIGVPAFFPEPTAENPLVCRRPHRYFVVTPVDPEVPPIFDDVQGHTINAIGWANLPGITLT